MDQTFENLQKASTSVVYKYTMLHNSPTGAHSHDFFEILIMLSGQIESVENGAPRTLLPGSITLLRPSDVHELKQIKNERHLHRDVYISVEKMQRICGTLSDGYYFRLCEKPDPLRFEISIEKLKALETKLLTFDTRPPKFTDYDSLHTCIVFELLSDYSEYEINHTEFRPEWLCKLLAYIRNPDYLPLKITDFADLVGYSREHMYREFKKYMGTSLEKYITSARINYSLTLLSETDYSITRIATELGYESQNSFTRNFRAILGITPIDWRKSRKNKQYPRKN